MNSPVKYRRSPSCSREIRTSPRALGSALFSELAWEEISRSLRLSGRELQIVQATFDDKTELALADELGISRRTVHTHSERLHRKLAVSNRAQLLVLIVREFLTLTAAADTALPAICPKQEAGRCPLCPGCEA